MARLPLLLALLLLSSGCAISKYSCPDPQDAVAWWRLRSEHVDLRTDMEPARAERLVRGLERVWAAHDEVSGRADPGDRSVALVVLRDEDGLARFTRHGVRSLTLGDTSILADAASERALEDGVHPALTAVATQRVARQLRSGPRWLVSGLGSYLGFLSLHPQGEVRVGVPSAEYLGHLKARAPLSLEALWAQGERLRELSDGQRYHFHASAWLWVHYLLVGHGERFLRFQRFLAERPPREAWAQAFAGLEATALEEGARAHAARADLQPLSLRQAPQALDVSQERLAPAEVHALHAELRNWQQGVVREEWAEARAALERELEKALERDPYDVTAQLMRPALMTAPAARKVELGRQLVAAHPEDPRAWVFLAEALAVARAPDAEQREVRLEAARRFPENGDLQNGAAWWLVTHGRADEAPPLVERALALRPNRPQYLDTHAAVAAAQGRCEEAVRVQERAISLLPGGRAYPNYEHYRKMLERYRAGCTPAP